MASKKTKAADDNLDVDELFSDIGRDTSKPKKPSAATAKSSKAAAKASDNNGDDDLLADLESQLASQQVSSRPHTPRLSKDIKRPVVPAAAAAVAADATAARRSTDSARSFKPTLTPSATSSELHETDKRAPAPAPAPAPAEQQQAAQQPAAEEQAGGGWWGGWLSTATATANAAMKQAEAAYKEIQHNEEAKKWTEQVKGIKGIDVGALRHYGDELRQRAMPTLSNILHTLAPPISSHERLLIHITHDLVGYPSLDPLIQEVFARVMSQVEGGELLVVQRGHESSSRQAGHGSAGWRDGPWWRQVDSPREMGIVKGLVEGTKLCRVGAESYATEYFAANGGLDEAKILATETVSETNPVRTSNLFLSVQAISQEGAGALFAGTAAAEKDKEESAVKEQQDGTDEIVCFAVYILDPIHEIQYATVSQSVPARWINWLDATSTPLTPASDEGEQQQQRLAGSPLPDDIRDIVDGGGVDPREWAAEWIEEILTLAVGVVAQRYVARRMGVGEGGLGKGKMRMEDLVQDNAGEAARAGLF